MTKKYDEIREKAKKLALIKGKEIIEEDPPKKYTKSAGIAAKKISDKYKKIQKKKEILISYKKLKTQLLKRALKLQLKRYQISVKN